MSERTYQLEHSDETLTRVHRKETCKPPCAIHSKTDHSMRKFPQHWRGDRWMFERICPHGVGHPDPDQRFPKGDAEWVHGCDGCCAGSYQ